MTQERRPTFALIVIGLAAGFLSGMFGVGGGVVIVPLLVLVARFERRRAAGTSLAAIVPAASVGIIAYALGGHVDLVLAGILAAGSIVGAQLGAWLLHRLPIAAVRWAFIVFLAIVAVQLFLSVPQRDAQLEYSLWPILGLVALGVITGILSGLLGVGGGIIVVPALIVLFGASDLLAKGSSLAMMIPTAISGTIANWRRRNVDLVGALLVGGAACCTTALGALVAGALEPRIANLLFAAFIVVIAVRLIVDARPKRGDAA